MTHLPYVAACFTLGLAIPGIYAVQAWRRLGKARLRLVQIDPRGGGR